MRFHDWLFLAAVSTLLASVVLNAITLIGPSTSPYGPVLTALGTTTLALAIRIRERNTRP